MVVDGAAVIHPSEYTTITFLLDGERPCDAPNGYYPWFFNIKDYKVPSAMKLQEFMKQLGVPKEGQCGITEMDELGDNRWTAGVTILQGTEYAKKTTLEEIGWTKRRSDIAPIWVVVKR